MIDFLMTIMVIIGHGILQPMPVQTIQVQPRLTTRHLSQLSTMLLITIQEFHLQVLLQHRNGIYQQQVNGRQLLRL